MVPEVSYREAHAYLIPGEIFCEENWADKYGKPVLDKERERLSMLVDGTLFEMAGISIPPLGARKLSSGKAIIESARRRIGDVAFGLKRCIELAGAGDIQGDFYFNELGLCDYSKRDKLDGKRVSEWVSWARGYSSRVDSYLPKDMDIPENLGIEFVSTVENLRNVEVSFGKSGDYYFVPGFTFADSISNFLLMYDAVVKHLDWKKKADLDLMTAPRRENKSAIGPFDTPISRLVVK